MIKKGMLLIAVFAMILMSCNSDLGSRPTVTTGTEISAGLTSGTLSGTITDDGGSDIVQKGLFYSEFPAPNSGDERTDEGSGDGAFTSIITNLKPQTTYYVRAYAKNEIGYGYGEEVSFVTQEVVVPCSPNANTTVFNGSTHSFSYVSYVEELDEMSGHDYARNSDLKIEFSEKIAEGLYETAAVIGQGKCVVTFEPNSVYDFLANSGDIVYVKKVGYEKYAITFCDLEFHSDQTSMVFTSHGNLTNN